jgi:hypothetical protein
MSPSGHSNAVVVREIAVPISVAVLEHRRCQYSAALDLMRPIIAETQRMGGSHAQHDVLRQLFLDCATHARQADDVRSVLALAARYPAPVDQRIGYAEATRQFPD